MTAITLSAGINRVSSGQEADNYAFGNGTQIYVYSGGAAIADIPYGGGLLEILAGGSAVDIIVSSGSNEDVSGTATGTVISSGGKELVWSGGSARSSTVSNGGTQYVFSGGVAGATVVSNGGELAVESGGTALAPTVLDSGNMDVLPAGVQSGGALFGTAYETVKGTTFGVVLHSGATQAITYGVASDTTVQSGAAQQLLVQATAVGTHVLAGGSVTIFDAASRASGTQVDSGGLLRVVNGSGSVGATVSSGGLLLTSSSTPVSTTLLAGGTIDLRGLSYVNGATASLNTGTDVLTVTEGSTSTALAMAGSYTHEHFLASNDGAGGTLITLALDSAPNGVTTWLGTVSGDWATAGNWSGAAVPDATVSTVVSGVASTIITLSGTQTAYSLDVSNPDSLVELNQPSTLALTTNLVIEAGASIRAFGGTIDAPAGVTIETGSLLEGLFSTINGNVVNNSIGAIGLDGIYAEGLKILGSLSGSGTTDVIGSLEIAGAASQTIKMGNDATGFGTIGASTLFLDQPASFSGTITNFLPGFAAGIANFNFPVIADTLDVAGMVAATASASYDGTTLTVTGGGQVLHFGVTSSAQYALRDASLTLSDDGKGGTDVSWIVGLTDQWIATGSGDWNSDSNWSLGFAPGAFDTAAITTAGAVTVSVASSSLAQAGTLNLGAGSTLAVAGSLDLGASTDLNGATISLQGGRVSTSGFVSLDHGTIEIADGGIVQLPVTPISGLSSSTLGSLTLGTGLTVVQHSGMTNLAGISAGPSFNNLGQIIAGVAGGTFELNLFTPSSSSPSPGSSTVSYGNAGTISVSNGDSLRAVTSGASFDNSGLIQLSGGGSATLGGSAWSNEGTIGIGSGTTLTLIGNFSVSSLAGIANSGTLVLEGQPYSFASGPITVQSGDMVFDPSFAIGSSPDAYIGAQFTIDQGATLELRGAPSLFGSVWGGANTTGAIKFAGKSATLALDQIGDFSGGHQRICAGRHDRFRRYRHHPGKSRRCEPDGHHQWRCVGDLSGRFRNYERHCPHQRWPRRHASDIGSPARRERCSQQDRECARQHAIPGWRQRHLLRRRDHDRRHDRRRRQQFEPRRGRRRRDGWQPDRLRPGASDGRHQRHARL